MKESNPIEEKSFDFAVRMAQSVMDFLSKMSISLKEAYESDYWLRLLYKTDYLKKEEYNNFISNCRAI